MSIQKRKKRTLPEISTSSLPDIIFMLLFFFMVTMVVKDDKSLVPVERPTAQLVEKIKNQDLTATIWIGYDQSQNMPLIQLDKQLIDVDQVAPMISDMRAQLPEATAPLFTTIIKADRHLPMYIVTDVKQELRKVNALKIQYSVDTES